MEEVDLSNVAGEEDEAGAVQIKIEAKGRPATIVVERGLLRTSQTAPLEVWNAESAKEKDTSLDVAECQTTSAQHRGRGGIS